MKIGSSLLIDDMSGELKQGWLDGLASDIARLKSDSVGVVIVSSGAIAIGRHDLDLPDGILSLEQKQAAAAAGQIRLAHAWQQALAAHQLTVAQVLLTLDDTEDRRRHLNARATINTLLALDAVPVINENDTVATEEIRYGDNDRLAARVAQMISADILVLLSDVDGLYSSDPSTDPEARFISVVTEVTPEIERMAGTTPRAYASGGMVTKLEAARIAMKSGCAMVIADGNAPDSLSRLNSGSRCTWFLPGSEPLTARKRWISGLVTISGTVVVDSGAEIALCNGKSLLPAGVTDVSGGFRRGDPVLVKNSLGVVLGRGLSAYSATDAALIKGRKSGDIEAILGYRGRDVLIHRDDLVLETSMKEKRRS